MAKVIGFESKIIEQYKAVCKHCGAIIIFDKTDIIENDYQYNEYCYSVAECPNCKGRVSFDIYKHK